MELALWIGGYLLIGVFLYELACWWSGYILVEEPDGLVAFAILFFWPCILLLALPVRAILGIGQWCHSRGEAAFFKKKDQKYSHDDSK